METKGITLKRAGLLNAIDSYQKTWQTLPQLCTSWDVEHETQVIQSFKAFISDNPNCFDRANLPGHTTGSALVVNETFTRVLLTHHRKLGMWLQLGGHADGNPVLDEVALTEAFEESGLQKLRLYRFEGPLFSIHEDTPVPFDLDAHVIAKNSKDPEHLHFDARYIVIGDDREAPKISHESHDVRWFSLDEARTLTREPSMLRQFAKIDVVRMHGQPPSR